MRISGPSRPALLRLLSFCVVATIGSGCDLHTKNWAEMTFGKLEGASMMLVDPLLELSLAYNRGSAFSLVESFGGAQQLLGAIYLALVGVLFAAVLFFYRSTFEALALGAIAAGAIGNGFDRLFREAPGGGTGVVDFVKINYPWGGYWPIFNVADVLLFCGGIALVLYHLRSERTAPSSTTTP